MDEIKENILKVKNFSTKFLYRLYKQYWKKHSGIYRKFFSINEFGKEIGFTNEETNQIIHFIIPHDYIKTANPRLMTFSDHGWNVLSNMVEDHDYSDGILPSLNDAFPNGV